MSAAVATSSFASEEALEEESSVLGADDALALADDEALLDALSSAEEDEDDAESPALEALLEVDAVAAVAARPFDAESSSAEAGNACRQNRQTNRETSARTNAPPMRCSCVTSMPRPPNPPHAGSVGRNRRKRPIVARCWRRPAGPAIVCIAQSGSGGERP
jgi:hypothetical protein